jgi:2-keto-4-pentenoate hydratase/2-oxohepta-3-ene-1,7-dioic acid hydratase in catechol pathway
MNFVDFKTEKIVPSKIVCVGRNYVEHIKELNNEIPENMVLFNKPNSAISKEFFYFENVRFEGELSFLVENKKIVGVGFGFDLTNAKVQNYLKSKGLPWERAKAFDKSAIFTKFIEIDSRELEKLSFRLFRNEKVVQKGDYSLMIYKPKEILEEIQTFMSLEDGDIIMSGTPKGVDFYEKNDHFLAQIFLNEKLILEESWRVV